MRRRAIRNLNLIMRLQLLLLIHLLQFLLNHNLRIILIIFDRLISFSSFLTLLYLIYFISIISFSFSTLLFYSWLREHYIGLHICWLDRLTIIERIDACRYQAILCKWSRVALGSIAAFFVLFTLLIDSSTQTFVRNFMLRAMIIRNFFLLSFQSFFKIFAVLLKQYESVIPKLISVLSNKSFQSYYCYKSRIKTSSRFIQPVLIDKSYRLNIAQSTNMKVRVTFCVEKRLFL